MVAAFWICSGLFGVPTLDIALLLKVVDLRTLSFQAC